MSGERSYTTKIWQRPSSIGFSSAGALFISMDPRGEPVISTWKRPCQKIQNGSEFPELVAQIFRNPQHFSGNHRVELTVTRISEENYIISDQSRTLGELRDAGYKTSTDLIERLEGIAKLSGLRIVQDHLVLNCVKKSLGADIQRFIEATKTIADVYLVHKVRPPAENDLLEEVKK